MRPQLVPLISGGGQESSRRSGIEREWENVALSKALRLVLHDQGCRQKQLFLIHEQRVDYLCKLEKIRAFTPKSAPHIVRFGELYEAAATPSLSPLVAMDRMDIVNLYQKIDTVAQSTQPSEDCCTVFVPAMPKPKPTPKLKKIRGIQGALEVDTLLSRLSILMAGKNKAIKEAVRAEFDYLL